ncbi:hypothetical protein BWI17_11945 [Betaproteobacteria bacterium GR16-43]|nr:hypothetical protein BWI17_11945 [Betaproteobacteria bacterium GR16-43]
MLSRSAARKILLALPDTSEGAHMGHPDFRVGNRIFASLAPGKKPVAVVKLSAANQTALLTMDPDAYSLNGWSRMGWTNVHLDKTTPTRFRTLAQESWSAVASAPRRA